MQVNDCQSYQPAGHGDVSFRIQVTKVTDDGSNWPEGDMPALTSNVRALVVFQMRR
jgi:hypothetical protein